jgi:DNA-binding response OmpR family regulator
MNILLIEDNPGDVRLVQEMLKETRGNFTISVAEKLGLGVKLLNSQNADVALLDLNLPDSNGLATITALQNLFPLLPIVIMTSVDDEELAHQAVQHGAQDFLIKGTVTGELLRRTLLYAIDRKRTEETVRQARDELEIRVQERTKELAAADSLIKSERRRLYSVLETLPIYVILLTPDYRVPFANRYFRKRFGESNGKRCYEYLFNRTGPCEICETFSVFDTNAPHHWYWTGPDGLKRAEII